MAGLAALGFFAANSDSPYCLLITIGSGLSCFAGLGGLLALSSPHGLNIKVVSLLSFLALLIEHLVFSSTAVRLVPYVVITGVLLLLYVVTVYAVFKALK